MEKDSILSEYLMLQKEVDTLSSSALMKEKEYIRKELEKTKTKLRETENKLKNSIQDKIKLQVINLLLFFIVNSIASSNSSL
jgi:centromeric protein E